MSSGSEQVAATATTPRCPHFGVCGGCAMQDLSHEAQIGVKEGRLRAAFHEAGVPEPASWFPALTGPQWHYRRKARLSVRYVFKKERVLVGFRERKGRYVTDMSQCHVLDARIAKHLEALAALIGGMEARQRIPQLEVACGDDMASLVFRHLDPLGESDLDALREFARASGIGVFLQPGGIRTIAALEPETIELSYALPAHGVAFHFDPSDFVQVNSDVNRAMVDRVIELLDLNPNDRVLDLFCGLGNFTLPIARHAGHVTGVEGDAGLVGKARTIAERNGIDNAEFQCADLKQPPAEADWLKTSYDKMLVDPPRSGAEEMLPHLDASGARRLAYVSCNPVTLARDAAMLTADYGFRLEGAGIIDMFPHTDHVESVALFAREA